MKGAVLERAKGKVWTYEDYLRLTDDKRYEVINGRLVELPAPTVLHQRILGDLYYILRVRLTGKGEVLISPVDVILSDTVVVQPDLIFVSKERLTIVKDRVFGPPDLVVEILSPGSYHRDRYEKFKLYEEFGVKEYWIVLPREKVIEVWCLKDGKYVLHSVAAEEGKVQSCVLKGLKLKVEEVLK